MAIVNEKSNMVTTVYEDTRFTSKANISIGKKDDSLAAVIVSANDSPIALIMDSNITVSTPIQDGGGQTDYTAAISTSGDYSTMLISNNVAKSIKVSNALNSAKTVEAYGIDHLTPATFQIGGMRFLQTYNISAKNTGLGEAAAYGIFSSGIYSSAQIVKNFTVSASAVGEEADASAYAFHSHNIYDEEGNLIHDGTLFFERGISGNISVTASSKNVDADAAALYADRNIDILGTMSGKINVSVKPNVYGIGYDYDEDEGASGIYSGGDITIENFNSAMTVSNSGGSARGIYASGSLYIHDCGKNAKINVTANVKPLTDEYGDYFYYNYGEAFGIYSWGGDVFINNPAISITVKGTTSASGISGDSLLLNGNLAKNITATAKSDYDDSYATGIYGYYYVSIGDITGNITATANGGYESYARGISGDVSIGDITGNITATANSGESDATGIYSEDGYVYIGDITGRITATANSGESDAATGIYGYDVSIGDITGRITATAKSDYSSSAATGIFSDGYVYIGDITGNITATATAKSDDSSSDATGISVGGDVYIGDITGNITATAKSDSCSYAMGIYSYNDYGVSIGDITGNITAAAAATATDAAGDAFAQVIDSYGYISLDSVRGTLTATATGSNRATTYGFTAGGSFYATDMSKMNLKVTAKAKTAYAGDQVEARGIDAASMTLRTEEDDRNIDLDLGKITVSATASKKGTEGQVIAYGVNCADICTGDYTPGTDTINILSKLKGSIKVSSNGTSYGIRTKAFGAAFSGSLNVSGNDNAYGFYLDDDAENERTQDYLILKDAKINTTVKDKKSGGMAYAVYTERIGSELVVLDGASTVTGIIDLGGADPNGMIGDYDELEIKSGSKLKGALINVEETTLEIGNSNNKISSAWDIVECDDMTATELEIDFDYGMTGTYVVCNKAASVEWSDAIKDNEVTLDLGDNRGEVTFNLDDSDNVYADTFYDFELETKGNKMLLTVTEKI